MSLLVYSTLSDYGRKVLGKSRSEQAKSSSNPGCGLAVKDCHTALSVKSRSEQAALSKNKIRPTPTPPNSPNYEHIQNELTVKTIEEPYSNEINKDIDKPKPDRTSFKICTIM
jgi:hypothetical protein